MAKKRNPQDATLRNVRAAQKAIVDLERQVRRLREIRTSNNTWIERTTTALKREIVRLTIAGTRLHTRLCALEKKAGK